MPKDAAELASELLHRDDGLDTFRSHSFVDDEEAHDDEATEKLYADFSADFDRVETALTKRYGKPARRGDADDQFIPLSGIFRFAIWHVGDKQLFASATHEDRGLPLELTLGTSRKGETAAEAMTRRRAEKDAAITSVRCPDCGMPCPSYRKTCKYCGKPVRGGPAAG